MMNTEETYGGSLPERVARIEERTAALVRGVVATREATAVKDTAVNSRFATIEQALAESNHKIGDHGYQIKMLWQSISDGRTSFLSMVGDIRERVKTLEVNSGALKRLEWLPIMALVYAVATHTPLADVLKIIK